MQLLYHDLIYCLNFLLCKPYWLSEISETTITIKFLVDLFHFQFNETYNVGIIFKYYTFLNQLHFFYKPGTIIFVDFSMKNKMTQLYKIINSVIRFLFLMNALLYNLVQYKKYTNININFVVFNFM
ncbi:hypothetical protein EDEG_03851 [Edhazardia aedis USNM 41457]|uniref:Uncharacterized protein n=1 Tax=Edhazardia aedis (strain USNM 41457) TaxID=1003232 RepID=J8ZPK4_EDHAE|nr:hypothetical protein EDEG_03851 [Edhazardia aedis USNM 41457]|eukprot:EJW01608.1 hypothetical protein EDEG_03851 [Edhazardia aedis USNM 41457]